MRRSLFIFLLGMLTRASMAPAAFIAVPNAGFEDYVSVGPTSSSWGVPGGSPPLPSQISSALTPNHLNEEFFSQPASFGSGWSYTGNAPTFPNNQWGVQHPADAYYHRASDGTANGKLLDGNFQGEFIGFMNVRSSLYPTGYVQSGILGQLAAASGAYMLQVAVGARNSATQAGGLNWNDVNYQIALVADPTSQSIGSTGGIILGIPATTTLVPSTATLGSNTALLTYTLPMIAGDPLIGHDYAVRIAATNTGNKNGIPNAADPQNFSQANFDNVVLSDIPEPASSGCVATLLISALSRSLPRRRDLH